MTVVYILEKKAYKDIHHKELDTILRFSALINSSLNLEQVLDNAMKYAEEFMEAEASSVYELDEKNNELFIRLARGDRKEKIKGIRLGLGEGVAGWVVKNAQPLAIQDVRKDGRFSDKFDRITGFRTKSMICVPLLLRGKPIGALQVLNKKSKRPFNQADLELLNSMSQQISIAMENARLYQRLQEKYTNTTRELRITQRKLIRTERLAAMVHLVQGVAHEIRNPIMTIGGFAYRIKKELNHNYRLQKYVDIILDESARLEKLVREVKEFTDVQTATLSLENIEPVVREALKIFKPLARTRNVKVSFRAAKKIPLINMDPSQIEIALSNIIENALEAMPDGGLLTLRISKDTEHVIITVQDSGCGISSDKLDAVYDPFVTSKPRGAGLGLTMVHQIILNHGGEISIESELKKGTLVTLKFPLPGSANSGP
ncbi:MAG: GAF domain-containing protein [Deltaproteobacteria bacterium]|nr:GAF domain-containing protein [Deltaproteobacteria bacterium]MBW2136267.1 GAF domain-containing protein [Deltaproteobacteria bacterium]